MLFRNCAGGIVFNGEKVFILKNSKGEWVLPKGKIRKGNLSVETAIGRVKKETGIDADIVSTAGETCYEFFSLSRQRPVCNEIVWYIMDTKQSDFVINKEEGFTDGGFFNIDKAIDMISYSQDKSLISLSFRKYNELKGVEVALA